MKGYVKSYHDKLTDEAAAAERWNAMLDNVQMVCHGFGLAALIIGLTYTFAVAIVLMIGEPVELPWMIGSLATDTVGALLLAM